MKVDKRILAELEATGLPWDIDAGGKHDKLRLNGKLVGIVSRGCETSPRALKNTISNIRRASKGLPNGRV
jgi:hypothetical protein